MRTKDVVAIVIIIILCIVADTAICLLTGLPFSLNALLSGVADLFILWAVGEIAWGPGAA